MIDRETITLAVDPAKLAGFAIGGATGVIRSGVVALRGKRTEERLAPFACWLEETIERHKPTRLAIERPFSGGKRASGDGFAYRAIAVLAAYAHGLELFEVAATSLKLAATGKGNAEKAEMLAAAVDRFGFTPIDHNEADALFILAWARGEIGELGDPVSVDFEKPRKRKGKGKR